MKKLVDISDLTYCAYVAKTKHITMSEFAEFLAEYPDAQTYYVVNCSECKHYEAKNFGLCKLWGSYNHLPQDFCARGDDTSKTPS